MKKWQFILFLAAAFSARAETIHCVSFEYPPLIHQAAGQVPEGLAVDIVATVLNQLGYTLKLDLYPWARSLAMAYQGEADCIFTLYRAPEREQYLDYSREAVATQVVYLYARKDLALNFDGNLATLAGLRVGTARKVNYGPKFEEYRPRLGIDEAPTIELNFLKLALGRIDVAPSHVHTATFTLGLPALQQYIDRIVRLPVPVETVPSYVAFSKKKELARLRDRFDTQLRQFMTSAEYRRLLEKYQLNEPPKLARLQSAP
jgi:polar amino acid transport system substrate-binding protein